MSHSRRQQPERRKGGSEAGSPPCAWPAVQNRSRGTRHSGRRGVGGRKGRRDLATCHPPPFNAFPPCQLPPRRRRPRPRPWRRRCTRLFQPPSRRGWRCRQRPEGGGGEQGVMQGSGCGWRGLTERYLQRLPLPALRGARHRQPARRAQGEGIGEGTTRRHQDQEMREHRAAAPSLACPLQQPRGIAPGTHCPPPPPPPPLTTALSLVHSLASCAARSVASVPGFRGERNATHNQSLQTSAALAAGRRSPSQAPGTTQCMQLSGRRRNPPLQPAQTRRRCCRLHGAHLRAGFRPRRVQHAWQSRRPPRPGDWPPAQHGDGRTEAGGCQPGWVSRESSAGCLNKPPLPGVHVCCTRPFGAALSTHRGLPTHLLGRTALYSLTNASDAPSGLRPLAPLPLPL